VAAAEQRGDEQREWVSFEHDGDTFLFDLTFLTSSWTCIFGAGCKGVLADDATALQQGCCSHGAHFADAPDRKRVRQRAKHLTDAQWQLRPVAAELGGPIARNDDGDWSTRQHDGACIFLNRNDFERGAGCALHVGALDAGESFLDWKPEVCWQVPLRLTHHTDDVGHTTWTLRDWKRRDWGEGGEEFHWWCTETASSERRSTSASSAWCRPRPPRPGCRCRGHASAERGRPASSSVARERPIGEGVQLHGQ
jgi:hypothetical protein